MDEGMIFMTRRKAVPLRKAGVAKKAKAVTATRPPAPAITPRQSASSMPPVPLAENLLDMSPLELRLDGLLREFAAWPHGSKTPPFLSTLLPDSLFASGREPDKDQVAAIKRFKERKPMPEFSSREVPDALLPLDRNEASSVMGSSLVERSQGIEAPLVGPGNPLRSPFPSNPIHPLFPPPGNFRSDPSRYLRPGGAYAARDAPSASGRQTEHSHSIIPQETLDAIRLLFNGGAAALTGMPRREESQSSSGASDESASASIAAAMQRLSERQVMASQAGAASATAGVANGASGMSKVELMNARAAARVMRAEGAQMSAQPEKTQSQTEVDEMNVSPSYVMDAEGDKRFFCANGQTFANLRDLHAGLLMMKDEHFRHHVSEAKNDFASWIKGVFGDQVLAAELSQVRSRALTAYKVGQRVRALKK
jgi:hypothetical protein